MTDKHAFKKMCIENGVGTIKEYQENDHDIEFPVFVKPVDSRGSRGQSVCYSYEELKRLVYMRNLNLLMEIFLLRNI